MASPEPVPVVIACPHCGTRYQVPYASIGPRGRNVLCAHCGKSWQAKAEPPPPVPKAKPAAPVSEKNFGRLAEEMLDEKFVLGEQRHKAKHDAAMRAEAEARAKAKNRPHADLEDAAIARATERAASIANSPAPALTVVAGGGEAIWPEEAAGAGGPDEAAAEHLRSEGHQRTIDEIKAAIEQRRPARVDSATHKKVQAEFFKRQRTAYSQLPVARLRRYARIAALAGVVGSLAGSILLRGPIVQQFPQLAGVYAGLGLGVNVVGMEFRDLHTLQSLRQGVEVLQVDGKIVSVASHEVSVPPVIVTLLGNDGSTVYQWSMTARATELEPGETVAFETELPKPPAGSRQVKLSFANGRTLPRGIGGAADGDAATTKSDADPSAAGAHPDPRIMVTPAAGAAAAAQQNSDSVHSTDNGTSNNGQNPSR